MAIHLVVQHHNTIITDNHLFQLSKTVIVYFSVYYSSRASKKTSSSQNRYTVIYLLWAIFFSFSKFSFYCSILNFLQRQALTGTF